VCNDAPQLGRVAFHLGQRAAKDGFLLTLGQRFLEQATQAVLLPLDPQKILNLLPRARGWDLRIEKRATQDLASRESGRFRKGIETGNVFIANTHTDEMPKAPHEPIVSSSRRLSSADLASRVRISRRR
jgi:hypothetical protein